MGTRACLPQLVCLLIFYPNTANYRDSLLNEDETGEENQILEPALRSRDSTEMSSPVSVELELCTQDNVAYSSLPWRQRQTTQPQEHQEGPLSQNDREIDQESVAIEPQQNIAYSAVTWRQSQATQQKASGEDTSSSRGHEIIGPESLQINIAYSSTFWRQDEDNQLQETEEEYSYVNIN